MSYCLKFYYIGSVSSGDQSLALFVTEKSTNHPVPKHYCLSCKYSTAVLTNIRRHVLIHTGERPYQCNHCGKKFRQKEHLKGHVTKHIIDVSVYREKM